MLIHLFVCNVLAILFQPSDHTASAPLSAEAMSINHHDNVALPSILDIAAQWMTLSIFQSSDDTHPLHPR